VALEGGTDDGIAQLLAGQGHGGRALGGLGAQGQHVLHGHVVAGARAVEARLRLVEGAARDQPLSEQLLGPEVLLLGVRAVGVRALDLRRLLGVLHRRRAPGRGEAGLDLLQGRPLLLEGEAELDGDDLHQRPSTGDGIAHVHEHLGDAALDLGADRDLLEGEQRAHGIHRALDAAGHHRHHVGLDRSRSARAVLGRPATGASARGHRARGQRQCQPC
jgi:hypothetical protein